MQKMVVVRNDAQFRWDEHRAGAVEGGGSVAPVEPHPAAVEHCAFTSAVLSAWPGRHGQSLEQRAPASDGDVGVLVPFLDVGPRTKR